MANDAKKATVLGLAGNIFLFLIKLVVGLLTGSITLISEAVNSFTDILSAGVVFFCVKIACRKPDRTHPFGHQRFEPVAGLAVAILAAVLGVEIINYAIRKIISGEYAVLGWLAVSVLLITIVVKIFMALYFSKVSRKLNSPAIKAMWIDCRNDVLIAVAALVGVGGNALGWGILDPLAGIFIGLYVIKQGYDIGKENIDYLVGRAPPDWMIKKVRKAALGVRGVKGVHDIKAHYVGSFIHVEVHIEVGKNLHTKESHAIGEGVQDAIEKLLEFNRAFVHIDPV